MTLIDLIHWEGFCPPSDYTEIKYTALIPSGWSKCIIAVVYALVTKLTHSVCSATHISACSTSREAFRIQLLLWSGCEQKAQGWRGSPVPPRLVSCQFTHLAFASTVLGLLSPSLCVHWTQLHLSAAGIFAGLNKKFFWPVFISSSGRASNHPPACSGSGPHWDLGCSFEAVSFPGATSQHFTPVPIIWQ